jgi:hypothetical protein
MLARTNKMRQALEKRLACCIFTMTQANSFLRVSPKIKSIDRSKGAHAPLSFMGANQ